jgi:hypothetical protein
MFMGNSLGAGFPEGHIDLQQEIYREFGHEEHKE